MLTLIFLFRHLSLNLIIKMSELLNLELMSSSWILQAGKYTIGRLSTHQIILDDVTVSRNHASIEIINEDVKIYDNNSTNGVYINGNLIQNHASIKSGDQLQIGKFQLLFTKD